MQRLTCEPEGQADVWVPCLCLCRRKYIPPNFAEMRHILDIAQVYGSAPLLKLITFDADGESELKLWQTLWVWCAPGDPAVAWRTSSLLLHSRQPICLSAQGHNMDVLMAG